MPLRGAMAASPIVSGNYNSLPGLKTFFSKPAFQILNVSIQFRVGTGMFSHYCKSMQLNKEVCHYPGIYPVAHLFVILSSQLSNCSLKSFESLKNNFASLVSLKMEFNLLWQAGLTGQWWAVNLCPVIDRTNSSHFVPSRNQLGTSTKEIKENTFTVLPSAYLVV